MDGLVYIMLSEISQTHKKMNVSRSHFYVEDKNVDLIEKRAESGLLRLCSGGRGRDEGSLYNRQSTDREEE